LAFPVNSASVQTAPCSRVATVMGRTKVGSGPTRIIGSAGCFVCKKIVGSNSWSQHSWGNALDLFPMGGVPLAIIQARLRDIANAVVYQAKHKTKANRLRKLDVAEVIDHDGRRIWTPSQGWHDYQGSTGAHIHVSASPLRTGVPPCA
jgi:hypothetical protein